MFHPNQSETREDIREYVAQLQLHMALQEATSGKLTVKDSEITVSPR